MRAKILCVLLTIAIAATAAAQFETRSSTPSAASPFSVAVGDFNGDGKLDFADAANNLQVFLGNGDGTFRPPVSYLSQTGALFVTDADFSGDGKLDLAVADLNGLFVLIGNGDGTFQAPAAYSTACTPTFVGTGDFNGDHKLDLLVTYSSGACPYVSVFLGNGDGTFQPTPVNTTPSLAPGPPAIADFNSDGKLDLAVPEQFGSTSQVEILLGSGNGSFSLGVAYAVAGSPESVAVADFRGNGKWDLAVASLSGTTDVLLGDGDGTFQTAELAATTPDAVWVVIADLNGDGKTDMAVASEGLPPGVTVILGKGDGTFEPPVYYPFGKDDRFVAVGDFNGDRKPDIMVPDYRFNNVIVALNTGMVSFSPNTQLQFPSQLMGTTSPVQTVTLTNTGNAALTISSMTAHGPFHESNTCGSSVAAGANCTISVTFKPNTEGGLLGDVSIIDSASSKPQVIALTGSGTIVSFSPNALNFPPQKVGTTSAPKTVTMTNRGTTALAIKLIYTGGASANPFSETNNCPASLNAGASCNISVTFAPKKTGAHSARLNAEDNGGGSPQGVPLSGTGD